MTLELTTWAVSRSAMSSFLAAAGIADTDGETDEFIPTADVHIHPFRPVEEIHVADVDGNTVLGFHANLLFYGASAAELIDGRPQRDSGGVLLPFWDRTVTLDIVAARIGARPVFRTTRAPVPAGYETASGVRMYDPGLISWRRNLWA